MSPSSAAISSRRVEKSNAQPSGGLGLGLALGINLQKESTVEGSSRSPLVEFDLQPLELRSPLDVKNRVGFVRQPSALSSPSELLSGMNLNGESSSEPAQGMSQSKSGEFEGPRAEWTAPAQSRLLMGVRAPSPPRYDAAASRPSLSAGAFSSQPRDGNVIGLGLELGPSLATGEVTPKASASHGQTMRNDSHIMMGIPFMPPRMPGAPRIGTLDSGRFDDRSSELQRSPIQPSLSRTWSTSLRPPATAVAPPPSEAQILASLAEGNRAVPMEREPLAQLDGSLPTVPHLQGLGITMPGALSLSSAPAALPAAVRSTPTPTFERPTLLRSNSVASDTTERGDDASSDRITPKAPFAATMASGRTPSMSSSTPVPMPTEVLLPATTSLSTPELLASTRAQSKMRSQQLIDTAMSSITAVAAVQEATHTANTAASVLATLPPAPSSSKSASNNLTVITDEERTLADSSPWGVFSVNKSWRPLAPPGIKPTAFVKKQQQQQSQAKQSKPATSSSKGASEQSVKKQKTVLGVKNINTQRSVSAPVVSDAGKSVTADKAAPGKASSAAAPRKRAHDRVAPVQAARQIM